MKLIRREYKFWFCVGSQDLYGEECLRHVAEHGAQIAAQINQSGSLPYPLVFKPVLISADMIRDTFVKANEDRDCAGVITWMHTFSPAKSWIAGLKVLSKPLLHFHTQFNEEIPYDEIDMDFMNENQSAARRAGVRAYRHAHGHRAQSCYGSLAEPVGPSAHRLLDAHGCGNRGKQPAPRHARGGQYAQRGGNRRRQGGSPD